MKTFVGDIHVHTGLSPCAAKDMTPNNIIRMAKLENRDFLVICDHHSVGNVQACQEVGAEYGLTVLPGMELETREGVHLLTIFPSLEVALAQQRWVHSSLAPIKNRREVFGEQLIFDSRDRIIGSEPQLLSQGLPHSLSAVTEQMQAEGALVIAAHVERRSSGLLGQLGLVPADFAPDGWEIGLGENLSAVQDRYHLAQAKGWVFGSDAHYLQDLVTPWVTVLQAEGITFAELAKALQQNQGRKTEIRCLEHKISE
ncbi:MAG: hypothetical protein GX030_08350 [Firmicutes bacterium]|nr:hypothetical protein [Bacillota bacterium]